MVAIYEMSHSPFCIPVTRALESLGVPFERIEVPNHDRSAVIRASGGLSYQVPLLVHDSKPVTESSPTSLDIAHYIDRIWGRGLLFPEDIGGLHLIVVEFIEDRLEDLSFKLVDPSYLRDLEDPVARVMIIRHKERKFGGGCVDHWARTSGNLRKELEGLLDRFDQTLRNRPFLFGSRPVYADFALFGILGNYTYRGYNSLPEAQTALASWWDRMRAFSY